MKRIKFIDSVPTWEKTLVMSDCICCIQMQVQHERSHSVSVIHK